MLGASFLIYLVPRNVIIDCQCLNRRIIWKWKLLMRCYAMRQNSHCTVNATVPFLWFTVHTEYVITDMRYVADQKRYCRGNCFLRCLKVCEITAVWGADNFDSSYQDHILSCHSLLHNLTGPSYTPGNELMNIFGREDELFVSSFNFYICLL
jgi:hypothetical protein